MNAKSAEFLDLTATYLARLLALFASVRPTNFAMRRTCETMPTLNAINAVKTDPECVCVAVRETGY